MKLHSSVWAAGIAAALLSSCSGTALKKAFREPANEFRPQPFLHLNGHLDRDHIRRQFTEARDSAGFGGIAVLPVSSQPHWYDGHPCPGMTPEYMSEEYFARYEDMLEISRRNGTDIILYDDIDFPSGSAGGRLVKEYPQYTRKYLEKQETDITGGRHCRYEFAIDSTMTVMAVSALETDSRETVDLGPYLSGNVLNWDAPAGKWKIMLFTCRYGVGGVHGHLVDYMQPEAVDTLMKMTYGEYDSRFSGYFGNVIRKTFFDDVGFVHMEQTWTPAITDIFREKYGLNPALYYPALFYDIGPETGKARIAFYDIRAELMAEGYVRAVSEWAAANGESNPDLLDFSAFSSQYLRTVIKQQIYREIDGIPDYIRDIMVDFYAELYEDYYAGHQIRYSEKKKEQGYLFWDRFMNPSILFRQVEGMMRDGMAVNGQAEIPNPIGLRRK